MCASTCAAEQKLQLMKFSFGNNGKKHNPPRRLWRKGLLNKGPHHLTIQNHEPCKYRTRQTGFSSSPFPACSSFRACASCKSAFVPLRTARPVCKRNGWKANTGSTFMHGMDLDVYLVVQVPGLIVFLCAFPAEDGLVVYLDELPFGTVAKVSKKAARGKRSYDLNSASYL